MLPEAKVLFLDANLIESKEAERQQKIVESQLGRNRLLAVQQHIQDLDSIQGQIIRLLAIWHTRPDRRDRSED